MQLLEWILAQRRFDVAHQVMHFLARIVDVQQSRYYLARIESLAQILECGSAACRVVIVIDLAQHDLAAVMQLHRHGGTLVIFRADLFSWRDVIRINDMMLELASMRVALGRAFVVVKRYAGSNDIDEREAIVQQRALDLGYELFLVTGKAARDIGGAE